MRPGASWDAYCPRSLEKESRRRNLRILINVEVHVWNWYLECASEKQLRLAHFKVFRCAFCQWMIHAGVLFGRHCKRLLLQRFFLAFGAAAFRESRIREQNKCCSPF